MDMKRILTLLVLALIFISPLAAQKKKSGKKAQYKKYPRDQITKLSRGDVKSARSYWEKYLAKNPDDLESHYGLAICYAQDGNIEKAMKIAQAGVKKGLPFARFLAGPRDLLKPLTDSAPFQTWANKEGIELLHGPTLGCLTDRRAKFWFRTWHEVKIDVHVSTKKDLSDADVASTKTSAAHDYTGVASVSGLKASTDYYYQLVVDGKKLETVYDFKTMPVQDKPAKFQIMFGGGAGYTPWFERMWTTIDSHKPLAYMALGDNVYIDTPTVQNTQKYCYYRRYSRPEYRKYVSSASVFAIWDDHDFVDNDGSGGPEIESPVWKRPVWNTFKNNFVNPSYGGGEKNPGCWFSCKMADVEFFLMDGRYYRDRKGGSMLGAVQKKWLLGALKNSTATFKVLCANVPMTAGVKPGSKDTWDGFPEEREEIFGWIAKQKIEGVFIIAADRHRSDAWKIDRPGAYPLYEFQSSKLTNIHTHPVLKGSLFGYNAKCSFGLLTFDTAAKDPSVTYDVFNIDNEKVNSFTLKKSTLRFK
jgi:alkaline phosphatase D